MRKRPEPTFTETLRERVLQRIAPCPTCGRPTGSLPKLAAVVGVAHSTLWRFCQGKAPSAGLIDKLTAFFGG